MFWPPREEMTQCGTSEDGGHSWGKQFVSLLTSTLSLASTEYLTKLSFLISCYSPVEMAEACVGKQGACQDTGNKQKRSVFFLLLYWSGEHGYRHTCKCQVACL